MQNYLGRKYTVGELCDRIAIGWTCCATCCEVNTGNKRTLVQQKKETLDLFYSLFRKYINLSLRKPDSKYIPWGLIWDPFYKEPKGRINISDMFTLLIVHRTY